MTNYTPENALEGLEGISEIDTADPHTELYETVEELVENEEEYRSASRNCNKRRKLTSRGKKLLKGGASLPESCGYAAAIQPWGNRPNYRRALDKALERDYITQEEYNEVVEDSTQLADRFVCGKSDELKAEQLLLFTPSSEN